MYSDKKFTRKQKANKKKVLTIWVVIALVCVILAALAVFVVAKKPWKSLFNKEIEEPETVLPVIFFENDDDIVGTDRDGIVREAAEETAEAEITDENSDESTPVIGGITIEKTIIGEKIAYKEDISWKFIAEIYLTTAADNALCENVNKIYFVSEEELFLYCDNNLIVNFDDFSDEELMFDKLERLSLIFASDAYKFENGTIYLTDDAEDYFRPFESGEEDTKIETEH